MDGLIGTDMKIPRIVVLLQIVKRWDLCVLFGFPRPDHGGLAVLLRLLGGLVAPGAGDDVVDGGVGGGAEVEGDGGKLGGGAALEEEDGVFRRDLEEGAEIRFGLLDYGEKLFAAVAHLHDAHARSVPVVELGLGAEEDVFREGGGAGGEVEDAILGVGEGRSLGVELGGAFDGCGFELEGGRRERKRRFGAVLEEAGVRGCCCH